MHTRTLLSGLSVFALLLGTPMLSSGCKTTHHISKEDGCRSGKCGGCKNKKKACGCKRKAKKKDCGCPASKGDCGCPRKAVK